MKNDRWVYYKNVKPQDMGGGVACRVLAYSDDMMVMENTFESCHLLGKIASFLGNRHVETAFLPKASSPQKPMLLKFLSRRGPVVLSAFSHFLPQRISRSFLSVPSKLVFVYSGEIDLNQTQPSSRYFRALRSLLPNQDL